MLTDGTIPSSLYTYLGTVSYMSGTVVDAGGPRWGTRSLSPKGSNSLFDRKIRPLKKYIAFWGNVNVQVMHVKVG